MVEEKQEEIEDNKKERNVVDEAKEERERLDKVREEMKKENDRAEKLMVQKEMAGKSRGVAPVEKTAEERYAEGAEQRYAGTGLNPAKGYKRQW